MLDGIAIALKLLVWKISARPASTFVEGDARLVRAPDGSMVREYPVSVNAEGFIDGEPWDWELLWEGSRTGGMGAVAVGGAVERLQSELREYAAGKRLASPPLPLVAYYGTGRPWMPQRRKGKKKVATNLTIRTNAHLNCLSAQASC